jgi:hypothetical protein
MSAMKANNPHAWDITLEGRKAIKGCYFEGTVDEALSHADVMESVVRFTVTKFTITRLHGVRVNKGKAA